MIQLHIPIIVILFFIGAVTLTTIANYLLFPKRDRKVYILTQRDHNDHEWIIGTFSCEKYAIDYSEAKMVPKYATRWLYEWDVDKPLMYNYRKLN